MLRRTIPVWLVLLLLVLNTVIVVAGVVPIIKHIKLLPFKEVPELDKAITITSKSFSVTGEAIPANKGSENSPIEMSNPYSVASTGASKGDYIYTFTIHESAKDSLKGGEVFKVDIFADSEFIGSIYVGQATSDPNAIEGVKCIVSLGREIKTVDIIVTRVRG